LNRIVLAALDRRYYGALFQAHDELDRENRTINTERETIRFILRSVFGIDPLVLGNQERVVAMLVGKHYAAQSIPAALERYVVEEMRVVLPGNPAPAALFSDTQAFYVWLGEQWGRYVQCIFTPESPPLDFADHHLRLAMNNLFAERLVSPYVLSVAELDSVEKLPPEKLWIRAGLLWPEGWEPKVRQGQATRRVSGGREGFGIDIETQLVAFQSLDLNSLDLRGWLDKGYSWGKLVHDFSALPHEGYEALIERMCLVRAYVDGAFQAFLHNSYQSISFYEDNKGPIALHRVNRYLHESTGCNDRLALLVFDGMAIDQWFLLREYLLQRTDGKISFGENRTYAITPTITSISRQSLFAGRLPGGFAQTALSTSAEEEAWHRFWQHHGRRPKRIAYVHVNSRGDMATLREIVDSTNEVLAIVVNLFDEVMHSLPGPLANKRVFHDGLRTYLENSIVAELVQLLLSTGYRLLLTSDHGNVENVGCGILPPQTLAEAYARRVVVFDREALARGFAQQHGLTYFHPLFLPDDLFPVYAAGNGGFASSGSVTVSHGGLSLEDIMVPLVEVMSE